MIYLTNGNMPLNAAYSDEIVQEDNSTYQLSFRFPTSDPLWEKLKEETFLTADDLHGEQDFVIFEVEKKHGYIQVYANQVFTLLNNYVVNPISLDRQTGSTALSRFAGSITRDNPFSFFSDIEDRHTFNIGSKNAMEAFAKDKHSIIGQWGGDLVRHGYQVRLLKNGGSENESLFMYKKNLSSYQHKTSTKSLKTRITFIATVKGEGEKAPDRTFTVTIDSPLINKYSQIYEDVIEVNDQDVKDEASLRKYGEQYYRTSLCDMMEDSLELEVVGQSDVPVQMFDIVSLFHDVYNLDVRKKITKYIYSPMAKKLKSIGFGQFQSGLANAIGNAVSDAVKGEAQQLQSDFERQLARELKNADLAFERHKEELVNQFTDGLNAAKAKAEEADQEILDSIGRSFEIFRLTMSDSVQVVADEALEKAGASSLLAQEAKRIGMDSIARLEEFKRQATSAQTALSSEIAEQVEALIQTKKELAGVKSAQSTYEETTTRRLSELTNLANGKASKSELIQTAEELSSKIASVQIGSSRNYFRDSRSRTFTTGNQATYDYRTFIVPDFWKNSDRFKRDYVRISFDVTFPVALANDMPAMVHFSAHPWYAFKNLVFKGGTTERQHFEFTIDLSSSSETYQTNNVFIRFGTNYGFPAGLQVVIENAMLSVGNYFPAYQPAYEDQEDRVSVVESNFKQRADSLDAGVNRLTEGLRTKADISSLNVTAENIRQSVKNLETSTQNKLNQMLSLAEFEVRAGSIRQEILNATKDKADKTLVVGEAGKLRTELSTVISGKANQVDFQRVQETSQLYERILGNTENGIADKVARMAVTNQIFQVEVGKYGGGGPNLVKNSDFKDGTNEWASTQNLGRLVKHGFYHNSQKDIMRLSNSTQSENFLYSPRFELERNTDYVLNFRGFNNGALVSYDVFILGRKAGETSSFSIAKKVIDSKKLSTSKCEDVSITFNSGEMDNAFIRFDNNGARSGTADLYITEVDLYKGYKPRPWQPHPEDAVTDANTKLEAAQTKMTQLAGSWAVQNINSAGDLISGINLGANGYNRFVGKLTHITGETLIDKAVIKSAMVDKLKTANFEAGSVTTVVLDAEAVTAEKLKVDQAFFNKLVANEAYLSQLFAKQAFINRVQSVTLDASQIKTGVLTGGRIQGSIITGSSISGGTITGSSISGATLTGHTKIQLGTYGSFDAVDGGLQINVPRDYNAKDGLGVQFIGSYGRGTNVPYGLYVYKDSDLTTSGTGLDSDDFLMTVNGYINAKGIGWLKTGQGSVNSKTTGTIGFWNSNNVSLSFGGPDNDIYYSYNGKAYSLWAVVNQHFSDRRLKENIVDCKHKALDYIQQFQFKEYDWKKQEDRPQQAHTKIGLIAQEVQKVDPTLVYENGDTLNLDNLRLTNIALKAIQELALENQKLTHRLENLENEYRTA